MDVDYELKLNCDDELPVIYMRVRLDSTKARRVSLTGFVDWVMGAHTSRLTRAYAQGGMALCEGDMPGVGWCAYVETDGEICLNLLEFLGTDGDRAQPGAMKRARLHPAARCAYTNRLGPAKRWSAHLQSAGQEAQMKRVRRLAVCAHGARPYARGARSKTGAQGWKG